MKSKDETNGSMRTPSKRLLQNSTPFANQGHETLGPGDQGEIRFRRAIVAVPGRGAMDD